MTEAVKKGLNTKGNIEKSISINAPSFNVVVDLCFLK